MTSSLLRLLIVSSTHFLVNCNACFIYFFSDTRRSFLTGGLIRKKLDTDVKIKVEPKDCDDVEMGEINF